ncbi:MAG TPA: hypothetical protein VFW66_10645 [Gemmatimonadales bacterium]|nr:hypothetical protein [Gemmatimonadales bacterium]
MGEEPPGRLDRAALERIIRRAAELQTSGREIGESLTPDEVMALGRDVGIPRRYLQQALLEENARLPDQPEADAWTRLAGPGVVRTHRVVRGDQAALEQTLLRWMEQQELFCVQRQQPGWITWEPIGGFQAAIRRSTGAIGGRRPLMLSKASTVSATFTPLEDDYQHVALEADVRPVRTAHLGGAATAVGAGAAASATLVALSALLPVALVPLPIGVAIGWSAVRQYRPVPRRVLLGLERALDQLEQGGVKPSHRIPPRTAGIIELLADEIRRSLSR